MNTWVEYYKFTDKRNNNHAQMKENAKWVDPDPKQNSSLLFFFLTNLHILTHGDFISSAKYHLLIV